MAGFTVAAGFALLFQSGQSGIITFTTFGRLDLDSERHVELAQEKLLGADVDVIRWEIAQVNDVPCIEGLLAIAVEGGCLLLRRVFADSFIGPLSQQGDLLAEVIEAQLVPPVGKDRMREHSLVHSLKVACLERRNLLLAGIADGQGGFHPLENATLDVVPFCNGTGP
jgi:hypothetical protein